MASHDHSLVLVKLLALLHLPISKIAYPTDTHCWAWVLPTTPNQVSFFLLQQKSCLFS